MELPLIYTGLGYTDSGCKYHCVEDSKGNEVLGEYSNLDKEELVDIVNAINNYPKLLQFCRELADAEVHTEEVDVEWVGVCDISFISDHWKEKAAELVLELEGYL